MCDSTKPYFIEFVVTNDNTNINFVLFDEVGEGVREEIATGNIKWDGCCNWRHGSCAFHICDLEEFQRWNATFMELYALRKELLLCS